MNLQTVKQEDINKCCPLDGVRIVEVRRGAYDATSITLEDAAGHIMVIEGSQYSSAIHILTKAPPKKTTTYTLTGQAFTGSVGLEIKINETFNSMADAVLRKQALEQSGGENFTITETEVEVEVLDE